MVQRKWIVLGSSLFVVLSCLLSFVLGNISTPSRTSAAAGGPPDKRISATFTTTDSLNCDAANFDPTIGGCIFDQTAVAQQPKSIDCIWNVSGIPNNPGFDNVWRNCYNNDQGTLGGLEVVWKEGQLEVVIIKSGTIPANLTLIYSAVV